MDCLLQAFQVFASALLVVVLWARLTTVSTSNIFINVYDVLGWAKNAGPENEGPMRDQIDQRPTDTTGNELPNFQGRKKQCRTAETISLCVLIFPVPHFQRPHFLLLSQKRAI